jgi:hypothetical protein
VVRIGGKKAAYRTGEINDQRYRDF